MSHPSLRKAAPLLALALIVGVFFGRALVAGETFFFDDLPDGFYAWKVLVRQMWQAGHVSLWLPWEYSGYPHQADIQRQLLYPPAWLFLFVDTAPAMVVFIGFHVFLAGALMMAFLRVLEPEADGFAVFCGGLVYAFAAYPVLHASQLSQLCSYAWVPLLLLAGARTWEAPTARAVALGAFAVAMLVYGGSPQIVYFGLLASLAFHALHAATVGTAGWRAVALCALATWTLGLGLAAPQLLPTLELQARSARAAAVTTAEGSAPPAMLSTLLHPYARGNPHDGSWSGAYTFHETCFYLGLVTLALAAAALADRRGRLLAALAALALLVALGTHLAPVHDAMSAAFPAFRTFRVPARWSFFVALAAACLTSLGMTRLRLGHGPRLAVTAAVVLASALVLFTSAVTLPLILVAMAAAAALVLHRWPALGGAAVAVALTLDLVVGFAARYIVSGPPPRPLEDFPLLRTLQARTEASRVVGLCDTGIPTQLLAWFPVYGIRGVQGSNPLYLRAYTDYLFVSQTGQMPGPVEAAIVQHNGLFEMPAEPNAMTAMLDAGAFVSSNSPAPAPFHPFGRVPVMLELKAREVEDAMGLAWSVPAYEVIADHEQRLKRLHDADFDPRSTVILAEAPGTPAGGDTVVSLVKTVSYAPERLEVDARVSRGSFLVLSEIDYPGWTATLDGAPTRVHNANDVLRAVWVPEGQHRVVMQFVPRSLWWGLGLCAISILVMAVSLIPRRRA